jgi:hypothetical protein
VLSGVFYLVKLQPLWAIVPGFVFFCVGVFNMPMSHEVYRFFNLLRLHLDVKDLEPVIALSPSEFDDLCIKRLQALAVELEEVEKRTKPFGKERLDARNKFKNAFDFFKDQGFIKGDWDPFFPKSETQR